MAQYRFTPEAKAKHEDFIARGKALQGKVDKASGDARLGAEQDLRTHMDRHRRFLSQYEVKGGAAPAPAKNGGVEQRGASHRVNLDTAAKDADEVEQAHRAVGKGVQGLNMDAIKAADRDKEWAKKSPEEQQAAAKSAKAAKPEGVLHSTTTPGSSHVTSMAAALATAGVSAPKAETLKPSSVSSSGQPTYQSTDKALTVTPAVSERNNMAVPRGEVDTSAIAGRTIEAKGDELQQAKDAAARGARSGNKAAEAAAAKKSAGRRSAASAMPTMGPQLTRVGDNGANVSSAPGRGFITPEMIKGGLTPAPAANPAPVAPTPSSAATPAAPSAPTTQPTAGKSTPMDLYQAKMDTEHGVSPGRVALHPMTARDPGSGRGKRSSPAATPKEAVTEAPTLAAPKSAGQSRNVGGSTLGPTAAAKAQRASTGPTAVTEDTSPYPLSPGAKPSSVGPEWEKHQDGNHRRRAGAPPDPLASQMGKVLGALGGAIDDIGKAADAGSAARAGAAQHTPLAPQQMARASSPGESMPSSAPSRGRAITPQSPEVGGGRGGLSQGGEHNVNVAGSNYGTINHNHNTYNVNYGTNNGTMGNVDHGYGPRGGGAPRAAGGGGQPATNNDSQGKFNVWYKDASGTHDLRKAADHYTGRTGGKGEKLDKTPAKSTSGGSQRPIKGSPRQAAGGVQQPQMPTTTGTGTTTNWQGPQNTHTASASGNGTAQTTPTP